MALSVVNNGASLNAQANLSKTNSALSKSLERLSTGLKINRGADGPAGLVISEQQRAQIAGLQTAIANTNKAVSLVQTGEGALNEISSLLTKVRSLALDSANSGVNDSTALAANQAEIANALGTISQIANTTQFGSKKLLDGSAALASSTAVQNLGVKVADNTAVGTYTITTATAATRANIKATGVFNTFSSGSATADLTGLTTGTAVPVIGGTYTGVTNRTFTVSVVNNGTVGGATPVDLDVTDSTTGVTKRLRVPANYQAGDAISDPTNQLQGLTLNFGVATNTLVAGESFTVAAVGTGTVNINGQDIQLNANNAATLDQTVATINSYSGQTGVKAVIDPANTSKIAFTSSTYGGKGDFTVKADAFSVTKLGLDDTGTQFSGGTGVSTLTNTGTNGATQGANASGSISSDGGITTVALTADGNQLSGLGLTLTLQDDPSSTTFQSIDPANNSTIDVKDNGLVFQIGANAGQTTNLRFDDVRADKLATGVTGNQFASLAAIDVTSASGAQDSLTLIDKAISDISSLRGKLGAFQTNTLESNANNLQSTLENTTAAESVVRDTDFASEIANFTRLQTQLQAGATVLGNANQTTQLVAQLLRG